MVEWGLPIGRSGLPRRAGGTQPRIDRAHQLGVRLLGSFATLLPWAALPVVALVLGGAVATLRATGARARGALQHLAAGVVFAVVAAELVPELLRDRRVLPLCIGFGAGVVLMLAARALVERLESGARSERRSPAGLLLAVGIDLAVDGLLLGMGFAVGTRTGVLISVALSTELLFLGLSSASALRAARWSRGAAAGTVAGLALCFVAGGALGALLLAGLSQAAMAGLLAFATAALLYLVTEELLVEAHEVPDTPLGSLLFFAGFLALLLLELHIES